MIFAVLPMGIWGVVGREALGRLLSIIGFCGEGIGNRLTAQEGCSCSSLSRATDVLSLCLRCIQVDGGRMTICESSRLKYAIDAPSFVCIE